jgi:hypothetical protein
MPLRPNKEGRTWHSRQTTILEKNVTLLLIFSFLVVTVGGIVQIVPLFYLENTIEEVEGMRPYSPLELRARHLHPRRLLCLPQPDDPPDAGRGRALRPLQPGGGIEYDHPFQWGSKRTGPDLARVGGRYSDEWHVDHLRDPQSVVPESVMPKYGGTLVDFSTFTKTTQAAKGGPERWKPTPSFESSPTAGCCCSCSCSSSGSWSWVLRPAQPRDTTGTAPTSRFGMKIGPPAGMTGADPPIQGGAAMSEDKNDKKVLQDGDPETTGHSWDGIKEFNNPLPRWWLWTFYACIVWAVGYTGAYPAWPLVNGATPGILGYLDAGQGGGRHSGIRRDECRYPHPYRRGRTGRDQPR